ncbi:MAG: hypothetical protein IKM97_02285 [Clostridia bacterium]|nr:hypothetical protein [Clostridia bacterium]
MKTTVKIYSEKNGEIEKFLNYYYNQNIILKNPLFWKKEFDNPTEIVELIGIFIDNKEKINANMWVSLDKDVFICVNDNNSNNLIKYIYERFPY